MVLALLPSEIARLILNYLIDQGLKNTSKTFLDECKYLAECKEFIERGILLPKTIHGKTLKDFLIINNTDLEGYTTQSATTQTDFEVSPKLPRHPQPLSYFLKPPGLLSSRRDSSQSSASGDSSFSLHNNNENAANSTTNTNEANKTEKNVDIIDLSKSTDNDETENVNNQQNNSAVIQLESQVYKPECHTENEKQPDVDQALKDDSNTKRKPILIGKNVEKLPQFSVSVLERQLDSIINDPDNYITTPNSDPLPTESLSITSSQNQQVSIAPLVQTQLQQSQLPTNNQTITTVLKSAPTSMQRSGDPLILIPVPSLNQTMIQQSNNGIISLTPANISSVSSQPFVINESQFTTASATPVGAFILPPAVATTPKLISTNVASNTINGVSIVATKTNPVEVNNQNNESPKPDNAIKPQTTTYRKIESMKIIMGNKQQGKENDTTAKVTNEEKSNTKETQNSSSSSILASILAVSAENTDKQATQETQTAKKETTPRVSVYELAKRRGNRLTPTIKVIFDKGAEEALAKRDAKKPLGAHNYRSPASHASSEANKLNDSFDENEEENSAENEQPAVEKYVSKLNAEEAASILDEFLANPEVTADSDTDAAAKSQETEEKQQLPVVKKRGRPRKYPLVENKATKLGDISCPIDIENIDASIDENKDAHTKPKRLRSKTGFGDRSGWF